MKEAIDVRVNCIRIFRSPGLEWKRLFDILGVQVCAEGCDANPKKHTCWQMFGSKEMVWM